MNAVEIEQAISDLADLPYDPAEFPYAFLECFDNSETRSKKLRKGTSNKSDIGGVLQAGSIHLKTCDSGTVPETLAALKDSKATQTKRNKVRFILATDGQQIEAEDLHTGDVIACDYADLPNHFVFFWPIAGLSKTKQLSESEFDVRATLRLNKLYVTLRSDNPDWGKPERRHDMNHFMARLIFCFFAEDTDIFHGKDVFTTTVNTFAKRDGSNTDWVIGEIFRAMDTPIKDRAAADLPNWANHFPFVNGGLFSGSKEVPKFSLIAQRYLIQIGGLPWDQINPDIFGSMIQAVADEEERSKLGMHYTSVPNILKVLNPLFLDDLREKLEEAGTNARKLLNLRKRMSNIRVFDPACGSGNFLVIAYKQMREIEAEVNRRRGEEGRESDLSIQNFRGIELRDFSAEIARLALIIAEYQCDVAYRGQKNALAEFLPLDARNWITCGNALRLDWLDVCPPTGKTVKLTSDDLFESPLDQAEIDFENEGGETYICGNPPYLGAKKKTAEQVEDMSAVGLQRAQLLDYVCAFIIKGLKVIEHTQCGMALVCTSSICQGEQVGLLWPRVFSAAHLNFAYRPFRWANSAANNAGVWCTIVGIEGKEERVKILYDDDNRRECESIAPYLIPGPKISVVTRPKPLSALSIMQMGSNPVDGKRLVFSTQEREEILHKEPDAERFFKKYGGTSELVSGTHRWCLWIEDNEIYEATSLPALARLIDACRDYRLGAGRDAKKAASKPHAFCYSTYENEDFITVGNTIGNAFEYVPCDIRTAGFVTNHAAFTIYGGDLRELSIVASTIHRIWAETIAGRLGNGTRYGNTVVYNTFPVPKLTEKNKADLTRCAEDILLAREAHFPATIADLYAPDKMPDNLRAAHDRNDETLERIYIGRRFRNDTERLEKLFEMYTKMTTEVPKA